MSFNSPDVWLYVGFLIFAAVCFAFYALRRRSNLSAAERIVREFSLPTETYNVLGADIGGYPVEYKVRANGTHGCPDAVFQSHCKRQIIVGEVKSRQYRGRITRYEQYQLTLYLGALAKRFPRAQVNGLFRYADRVVPLQFNPELYAWLLDQIPHYHRKKPYFS